MLFGTIDMIHWTYLLIWVLRSHMCGDVWSNRNSIKFTHFTTQRGSGIPPHVSLHLYVERLTCAFYGQTSRHSRLLAQRQVHRSLGIISVYSLECRQNTLKDRRIVLISNVHDKLICMTDIMLVETGSQLISTKLAWKATSNRACVWRNNEINPVSNLP